MKNDTRNTLILSGIVVTIGALTGWALSSTALSPLVIGGIVGYIAPALITAVLVGSMLHQFYKKDPIENKDPFVGWSICTLASAAIGVGLAAAATAVFPGAMLGISPALAGAVISPIAFFAAMFATNYIIQPIVQKVNEYIISPIIERFSSRGEKSNLPQHVPA